jgi:type VI secretion system protein ImpA
MPVLDLDALLEPIPGADPAGAPVPYLLRTQLEEARKESGPADLPPDDPTATPRPIDWAALVRTTQGILTTQSKDLLVAARLTEALARAYGFSGLTEGLTLLRRLLDEAWERIYPIVEDGDWEVRAAPLNWLGEPDRGARFPATLRSLPLVGAGNLRLSWLDWRRSQDKQGPVDAATFEQAVAQTSREDSYQVALDLRAAVAACAELLEVINRRLGEAAPSMQGLCEALGDCRTLAEQVLARKGGPPAVDGNTAGDSCASSAARDASAEEGAAMGETGVQKHDYQRAVLARNDAYRRLAEVGEELRVLEPHSPVPVLIQTAVKWGDLSFPELIRIMVQEEGMMSLLSRQAEAGAEEAAYQDS